MIAPDLDEPLLLEAFKLAGELTFHKELWIALLCRLRDLGFPDRAIAQAKSLGNEDEQADILSHIGDQLPTDLYRNAISFVLDLAKRDEEIMLQKGTISESSRVSALARLVQCAPESALGEAVIAAHSLKMEEHRIQIIEASVARMTKLGRSREAYDLAKVSSTRFRATILAQIVVCSRDQHLKRQIGEEILTLLTDKPHYHAEVIANILNAFAPNEQLALLNNYLMGLRGDSLLPFLLERYLIHVLPNELLPLAIELTDELKGYNSEYDRKEVRVHVGLRAVELGKIDEAVNLVRRIGDSYEVGDATVRLVGHLAKHGYEERAVAEALGVEEHGREHQVPHALAAVAPYVSEQSLQKLLERAEQLETREYRKEALQSIAPRYAQIGKPLQALALANRIEDREETLHFRGHIAICCASELEDPKQALTQAFAIPDSDIQVRTLRALAKHLPRDLLREAITRMTNPTAKRVENSVSYDLDLRRALADLLVQLAELNAVEEAWQLAECESTERYFVLAKVSDYLSERERSDRLEALLREVTTRTFDLKAKIIRSTSSTLGQCP